MANPTSGAKSDSFDTGALTLAHSSPKLHRISAQTLRVHELLAQIAPGASMPSGTAEKVSLSVDAATSAAREVIALLRLVTGAAADQRESSMLTEIADAVSTVPKPGQLRSETTLERRLATPLQDAMERGYVYVLNKVAVVEYGKDKPVCLRYGIKTVGELVQVQFSAIPGTTEDGANEPKVDGMLYSIRQAIDLALKDLGKDIFPGMELSSETLELARVARIRAVDKVAGSIFVHEEFRTCESPAAKAVLGKSILELSGISAGIKKVLREIDIEVQTGAGTVQKKLETIGELVQLSPAHLLGYQFPRGAQDTRPYREGRSFAEVEFQGRWGSFNFGAAGLKFVNALLAKELTLEA
jgi:hypothetical protein